MQSNLKSIGNKNRNLKFCFKKIVKSKQDAWGKNMKVLRTYVCNNGIKTLSPGKMSLS